ncbi:LysR substrate-binding domain-containing protein [Noviherbaspirillum denitrificans]|uniref:LysR family transcriptional regulator n=1 Tax=Noviherbaspirillum denitrificans TaxID=1968433 RepID=A0A254TD05_9BURK|nr:LysR substrate-binding domain-containing protein [Noviherbaspirillum denitrificans]OWW20425.1 LysR family transcriptional regulator [Noviherbaspirillum denitrificans]
MELRQLRYFVRVVELGSMGRAALEFGVVTSALSQQISQLESELSTRLLIRTSRGTIPTDAGLAFLRQAQLALRHVDGAAQAARQARLTGQVSIGLAPSTAAVLGMPFLQAMQQRYPDVRLHLVESLSGHLAAQLNERRLDLAVLFETQAARRWSVIPLLDEQLYVVGVPGLPGMPTGKSVRLDQLKKLPIILPSGTHGLRSIVTDAFARAGCVPFVAAEIDGLALLMDAVRAGAGATIQPWSATARLPRDLFRLVQLKDREARRRNVLASLSDDELSPAALAARVVLAEVARSLVVDGHWLGATLHNN